jgi:hypothetical protein
MRKLSRIALVGLAVVLAAASPSYAAAGHGGHGFSHSAGGHVEGGHPGFAEHHGFDGRGHFDRRDRGGAFVGVPFYWAPGYSDPSSSYWYYCPSYGAYYPTVPSCPESWVPVPG